MGNVKTPFIFVISFKEVNEFLETNKIKKTVSDSVSDSTICIDGGAMGVIRVLTYEE